mmetsp:Transcript_69369/g.167775  ORF Transcript_69369/g.167775 Transcript_69369/m.167775 type:complete len:261 (+) Transcript_69369:255-1037(+)
MSSQARPTWPRSRSRSPRRRTCASWRGSSSASAGCWRGATARRSSSWTRRSASWSSSPTTAAATLGSSCATTASASPSAAAWRGTARRPAWCCTSRTRTRTHAGQARSSTSAQVTARGSCCAALSWVPPSACSASCRSSTRRTTTGCPSRSKISRWCRPWLTPRASHSRMQTAWRAPSRRRCNSACCSARWTHCSSPSTLRGCCSRATRRRRAPSGGRASWASISPSGSRSATARSTPTWPRPTPSIRAPPRRSMHSSRG